MNGFYSNNSNSINFNFIMKAILLHIISTFFNFNSFAQIHNNHLTRDNLNGKVKSISFYSNNKLTKIRTYNINGFETSFKLYCGLGGNSICSSNNYYYDNENNLIKQVGDDFTISKKYDKLNNILEETQIHTNSKRLSLTINNIYDSLNITQSIQINYQPNGRDTSFTFIRKYRYNKQNLLEEEISIHKYPKGKPSENITKFSYNDNGDLISKIIGGISGEIGSEYYYTYNLKNQKIAYQSRSKNGSSYTNYDEYFKYNEIGEMIESSHFDTSGILIYKDLYEYTSLGSLKKRSHYKGDTLTVKTINFYDGKGSLIERQSFNSNILYSTEKIKVDNFGNNISFIEINGKGITTNNLKYLITYYD